MSFNTDDGCSSAKDSEGDIINSQQPNPSTSTSNSDVIYVGKSVQDPLPQVSKGERKAKADMLQDHLVPFLDEGTFF